VSPRSNCLTFPLPFLTPKLPTPRTAVLVGTLQVQGGANRLPVSTWISTGYGCALVLSGVDQAVTGVEGLGSVNISTAGKTLTIDNVRDFVLSGAITGSGRLLKKGAGTQTLNGACTYAGATQVTNGALQVNGSLSAAGSSVTVYPQGTLSGTGTISRAVTVAGGTLAPGATAGALTVSSNVTFAAGSTLRIVVGASGAGRLAGGRAVALNGALTVTLAEGYNPRPGQSWDIVTAAGGVSGAFASRSAPGFGIEQTSDRITLVYGDSGTLMQLR
jgi:autotransporter-associated beta strand protein